MLFGNIAKTYQTFLSNTEDLGFILQQDKPHSFSLLLSLSLSVNCHLCKSTRKSMQNPANQNHYDIDTQIQITRGLYSKSEVMPLTARFICCMSNRASPSVRGVLLHAKSDVLIYVHRFIGRMNKQTLSQQDNTDVFVLCWRSI